LLQSLQEVAHGYPGSDIASVALRWLLQRDPEEEHSQAATAHADGLLLPPVAGVVVSSQLRRREEDCFASRAKPSSRAQALRKVFTFSLSDAEMELINSLSGWADDAGADGEMAEAASDGRVRLSL
jgi:diketogulonate reductase-like aldo/keto reductase